jgi:RNA polymerase sigma-70 factor (ECF subfamily)
VADKQHFIEQIEANQGLVNKVIFLYADDAEDRKDLRQEIISQAWHSFKNFRGEAKFSTWLYRVALNTAVTHLKKQKTRKVYTAEHISSPTTDQGEGELLQFILGLLNPIEKSIVLLTVEGYKQPEIAELLGISHENVRVKMHRIRNKLEVHGVKGFA